MADERHSEPSATANYGEVLVSEEPGDLHFRREQAIKEYGEALQRVLDDGDISLDDPLRQEAASLTARRRALFQRVDADLLEDCEDPAD